MKIIIKANGALYFFLHKIIIGSILNHTKNFGVLYNSVNQVEKTETTLRNKIEIRKGTA